MDRNWNESYSNGMDIDMAALTLFGTDGIRGRANQHPLTPEMTVRIGRAVGRYFSRSDKASSIVIGRDTRISGPMLAAAMSAGICAAGCDVLLAGILPTPAVSFLVNRHGAAAGVVISASHNPYEDNGIKLFGPDGHKLSETQEAEIESMILAAADDEEDHRQNPIGTVDRIETAAEDYLSFLRGTVPEHFSLKGCRMALDCANGATSGIAARLLATWGADLVALYDRPDGININHGCGSEHTDALRQTVIEEKADLGIAFDGDGDRMIAVDETGRMLSGDQILAIGARFLKGQGKLGNNRVVSTVMSNLGLKEALQAMGIEHESCRVGDRFVMEAMRNSGAVLGGEDSGHMIYRQHHSTGDGLISALKLLEAKQAFRRPLSELGRVMTPYPQRLENVPVREKPDLEGIKDVKEVIAAVEARLGERGRVLVRYSGTQSICRVMVEGRDKEEVEACCHAIAEVVAKAIGE